MFMNFKNIMKNILDGIREIKSSEEFVVCLPVFVMPL